jgi:hypothetical protein
MAISESRCRDASTCRCAAAVTSQAADTSSGDGRLKKWIAPRMANVVTSDARSAVDAAWCRASAKGAPGGGNAEPHISTFSTSSVDNDANNG